MVLLSGIVPRSLYLLTISIPFWRTCFSHLSYFGLVEIWWASRTDLASLNSGYLSYFTIGSGSNSPTGGIGSGNNIWFFLSYNKNFFSWFLCKDFISSSSNGNMGWDEWFWIKLEVRFYDIGAIIFSSTDSMYFWSLIDWSAYFWRSLVSSNL